MFSPMGIAIITTCLPSSIQGRALGIMATAQGLGFSLGPVLGGYVNSHMGWHGIFFVNIPIGVCVLIAAFKVLPSKQEKPSRENIDYLGALLISISLISHTQRTSKQQQLPNAIRVSLECSHKFAAFAHMDLVFGPGKRVLSARSQGTNL